MFDVFCKGAHFEKIKQFFSQDSLPASTTTVKLQNLRALYEYISFKTPKFRLRDTAQRFLEELQSFNFNQRQQREATAVKQDNKLKSVMIERHEYLSAVELTTLGESCFQEAHRLVDVLNSNVRERISGFSTIVEDFVDYCCIALMLKGTLAVSYKVFISLGACYRSDEFRFMLINTMYLDGNDNSWRCFVTFNKNRTKKARGALLFFDSRFTSLIQKWLKFRLREKSLGNYFLCTYTGGRLTAPMLTRRLKEVCHSFYPHFSHGTPRMLRFLQSAHIWSRYQNGLITEDQMHRLCKIFDRSLETWEKNYAFSNDVYDRNPGQDNLNMLWILEPDNKIQELTYLNQIAVLSKINEDIHEKESKKERAQSRKGKPHPNELGSDENPKFGNDDDVSSDSSISRSSWPSQADVDIQGEKTEATPKYSLRKRTEPSQKTIELDDDIDKAAADKDRKSFAIFDSDMGLLLRHRDLEILLSPTEWLNDAVVSSSLSFLYFSVLQQKDENWGNPLANIRYSRGQQDLHHRVLQHVFDWERSHWYLACIQPVDERYLITIYDSLNSNNHLSDDVHSYFSDWLQKPYDVVFEKVQQQPDGHNCGVFTVAFATEIAFTSNFDLSQVSFDVSKMRPHLHQCLLNRRMEPFPKQC